MDGNAFIQGAWAWRGSVQGASLWLQAASQEPGASFLSQGAVSTAHVLGLPLLVWAAKPQGRYPGVRTLEGHSEGKTLAFSSDGKLVVSRSDDVRRPGDDTLHFRGRKLVKIWDVETGAEVMSVVGMG